MQSLPVLGAGVLRSCGAPVRRDAAPGGSGPGGSGPVRRLLVAVFCCLLAGAGVLLAGAAPAGAHAALLRSDPQQGAVLAAPPSGISLTFSEQVAMEEGSVRVLDPAGLPVTAGRATATGADTYRTRLRTGLGRGTYTVAYQVVSADSHPISGAFTFSVGAPSATSARVPDGSAGGGVVGGLYDTARYASYAGFILLVGGAAFVLACWPRGAGVRQVQRLVVSGWVAMTAATLALLLMRGAYTGSGGVADIADLGLLGGALHTKPGSALVSRLVLLAVAALFVAVLFGVHARRIGGGAADTGDRARTAPDGAASGERGGSGRSAESDLAFGLAVGGAVVAIGLAATWALSEHASAGIQTRLAMPVDVVHLLAVAVWLGGLAALLTALYQVPAIEAAAVRRFSALAFASVLTLVATGLYQSWRQVGSWSALAGTGFGRLLLVKVGLVAVVVLVAASSRRWTGRLVDRAAAPDTTAAPATATTTTSEAIPGPTTPHPAASGAATSAPAADTTSLAAGTAPPGDGDTGTPSPERTAQLARQQAAKVAALRRRLREADPVRSALRRSVLAEATVAVVLLAVTTVLTSTETGRTEEQAAQSGGTAATARRPAPPVSFALPYDTPGGAHRRGSVMLDLTPSHPGPNALRIMVMDPQGEPVDVPEVTARLTLAARHIGPLDAPLRHTATGTWIVKALQIPMAGDWRFDITVRTSGIDQVTVHKNAEIG